MITVEEVFLENRKAIQEVKTFLNYFDLQYESDIDYTIAIYDDGNVIATASKTKNVLKCFAIDEKYQGKGITNSLVKKIEDRMFEECLYHFFIYTKSCNKEKFTSIGYKEMITVNGVSILENGNQQITSYLEKLKSKHSLSNQPKACVVMNANPFTLGHKSLIETAAKRHDEVIVFVVSEDQSSFPFDIRIQLVREGVKEFTNVHVIETGPYLISTATFPTYFLKKDTDITRLQTEIDCHVFVNYYKKIFNITTRYIGEEPYCDVTNAYNDVMESILPLHGVTVKKVARIKANNHIISASNVREFLKEGQYEALKAFVPLTTYDFLTSNEAKGIIDQLKTNDKRH